MELMTAAIMAGVTGFLLKVKRRLKKRNALKLQQPYAKEIVSKPSEESLEQCAERKLKRDLAITGAGVGFATAGVLVAPVFYFPSIVCSIYGSWRFIKDAHRVIKETGKPDYRTVLAVMMPAALLAGYIWTAAFGFFLGMTNWYLAAKTESRSKRSIVDLFGGQVDTAWLLVDGTEIETPLNEIKRDDLIVVNAGQVIPVDGVVIQGTATLDQHRLTGESQPVEKSVNDRVLTSTMLLSGCLTIRVEQAGEETVAGQVAAALNQTTDFKRMLQSRTDRWLNWVSFPVVALSAVALPIVGTAGAVSVLWYYPGVRMIVFGPISMLSYLQVAAQDSILIKDGRALETLNNVDTVVFDKTGTLTQEQPTVSLIDAYHGYDRDTVLCLAAAAEARQSHPIAQAILQAANTQKLELPPLDNIEYKVGYGLQVQIAEQTVHLGSLRFMQEAGFSLPQAALDQQASSHANGHSLVFIAINEQVAGTIELQPTIRPEAEDMIRELHKRGLRTIIISGDSELPTQRLAEHLGVSSYYAEVLPQNKADLVEQLKQNGHKVCFIGDGINDSIALKTADVAISLSGATTVATDMAEIIFMDGTLSKLPRLFKIADDFSENMNTNIVASTLPGVVGIAGTFLFGWGMGVCLFLTQVSTPIGIYNSIKPLLKKNKSNSKISVAK
ncbi:MAG TPA: heavy metal translocating P-type ATPase [Thiothrix sp.]|nr:heavy metal translocating P-type ATPase [Thiothrix sp.]